LDALRDLPDDASIEDAIYRLCLLAKIDRGLAQAAAGNLLSQDEVRRRLIACATRHGPGRDRT
jgi:predicted transcriptional regulator